MRYINLRIFLFYETRTRNQRRLSASICGLCSLALFYEECSEAPVRQAESVHMLMQLVTRLTLEEHSVERNNLRQRQKSENWASLAPRSCASSAQPYVGQKSLADLGGWETPWPLDYNESKQ